TRSEHVIGKRTGGDAFRSMDDDDPRQLLVNLRLPAMDSDPASTPWNDSAERQSNPMFPRVKGFESNSRSWNSYSDSGGGDGARERGFMALACKSRVVRTQLFASLMMAMSMVGKLPPPATRPLSKSAGDSVPTLRVAVICCCTPNSPP